MFPKQTYPCSHSMLESVYTRIFPQRGHSITWIMQAGYKGKINGWELCKWNETPVYVIKGGSSPLSRYPRRFIYGLNAVKHILAVRKIDLVQVRNDWVTGLIAVYLKRKYGLPFVFQVSFPIPEAMRISGGIKTIVSPFFRIMRHILLQEATLVLPISNWMVQYLADKENISPEKMLSFPLGADPEFREIDLSRVRVREKWNLGENPVVIYFGSMDKVRNLGFLLRSIKLVTKGIPNVRLLMVGGSINPQDIEWLKSYAAELNIQSNVIFTGWVIRDELPYYIESSNIGVSPIPPIPIYQLSSPTKLMETMAMAKAVVATDIPEQKAILEESKGGICTPYEENSFAEAIMQLLRSPDTADLMGRLGRNYIEKYRSYQILASLVEERYFSMIDTKI